MFAPPEEVTLSIGTVLDVLAVCVLQPTGKFRIEGESQYFDMCACLVYFIDLYTEYCITFCRVRSLQTVWFEFSICLINLIQAWMLYKHGCMCVFAVCVLPRVTGIVISSA